MPTEAALASPTAGPVRLRLCLERDVPGPTWTLGRLRVDYLDGRGPQWFGYACEDFDRGLTADQPLADIEAAKVPGETAIPAGTYTVAFTWSPKYNDVMRRRYGREDGHMPEVLDVPGFRGIRLHSGNDDDDTAGCILPGLTRDVVAGTVGHSRAACEWLYGKIAAIEMAGGVVELVITTRPPLAEPEVLS